MLSKRTNVLFDESMWQQLTSIAQEKKTSVGDLVRTAVQMQYLTTKQMSVQQEKMSALKSMHAIRKQFHKKDFDVVELQGYVDDGKKY